MKSERVFGNLEFLFLPTTFLFVPLFSYTSTGNGFTEIDGIRFHDFVGVSLLFHYKDWYINWNYQIFQNFSSNFLSHTLHYNTFGTPIRPSVGHNTWFVSSVFHRLNKHIYMEVYLSSSLLSYHNTSFVNKIP
jgi:hypothetical protein